MGIEIISVMTTSMQKNTVVIVFDSCLFSNDDWMILYTLFDPFYESRIFVFVQFSIFLFFHKVFKEEESNEICCVCSTFHPFLPRCCRGGQQK